MKLKAIYARRDPDVIDSAAKANREANLTCGMYLRCHVCTIPVESEIYR